MGFGEALCGDAKGPCVGTAGAGERKADGAIWRGVYRRLPFFRGVLLLLLLCLLWLLDLGLVMDEGEAVCCLRAATAALALAVVVRGVPMGTEGEDGTVAGPFRAEDGRDVSALLLSLSSNGEDLERGRTVFAAAACLGGVCIFWMGKVVSLSSFLQP